MLNINKRYLLSKLNCLKVNLNLLGTEVTLVVYDSLQAIDQFYIEYTEDIITQIESIYCDNYDTTDFYTFILL